MTPVWVIERGEYSDYHVVGIFSSKKNAQRVLRALHDTYSPPTIKKWTLDPGVAELNAGLTQWQCDMLKDGTVERCESSGSIVNSVHIWRRASAPIYEGKKMEDCLHGMVWAKNAEHAIKIFNEKRMELIALNKW